MFAFSLFLCAFPPCERATAHRLLLNTSSPFSQKHSSLVVLVLYVRIVWLPSSTVSDFIISFFCSFRLLMGHTGIRIHVRSSMQREQFHAQRHDVYKNLCARIVYTAVWNAPIYVISWSWLSCPASPDGPMSVRWSRQYRLVHMKLHFYCENIALAVHHTNYAVSR